MERVKGFEPSTPTLARLCSTPELHPRRTKVLKHPFLLTRFISKPDKTVDFRGKENLCIDRRPGDDHAGTLEDEKGGFPTDTVTSRGAGQGYSR